MNSVTQKGRRDMLTSMGKRIAELEGQLTVLRATQKSLIRKYEQAKYQDEITKLNEQVKYFKGQL